jgi:hypothetical protein
MEEEEELFFFISLVGRRGTGRWINFVSLVTLLMGLYSE